MRTCGFTGTQQGMAPRQKKAVRQLLWLVGTLHLGDCIGADAEAYEIAGETGTLRVGHPPTEQGKRAFLDYEEERPAKTYLKRNRDIVAEGIDGLIAAPKTFVAPPSNRGEGTWTTIGYARQAGRKIWIVKPDGTIDEVPARG